MTTRTELEAMKPRELFKFATDLGLNPKGKSVVDVITLVLTETETAGADEGEQDPANLTEEQIIAAERADMEGEDEDIDSLPAEDEEEPPVEEENVSSYAQVPSEPAKPTATQTHNLNKPHGKHWPTPAEVQTALKHHIQRGLKIVKLTPEQWHFKIQNREAAGNMKMPLNTIVQQAAILLRPTARPTEDMSIDEIVQEKIKAKARQ